MMLKKAGKSRSDNWMVDSSASKCTKTLISIVLILILSSISGCSSAHQNAMITEENDVVIPTPEERSKIEAKLIAQAYYDIYENAVATNTLGSLEVTRSIINRLGEKGYIAVDNKNQIDMTGSEQVMQFCEQINAKEEAELTIMVVTYLGGFTKYDLRTEEGKVDIVRGYYQYVKGELENLSTGSYRASSWQYTEEGYLLFEGNWFSDEYYMLAVSEVPDCVALRVQPLDEKCRELNRKYILPISYGLNNMFFVDWSESNFGELNFYDLYDIFYPMLNGQEVPYEADEDLEVGAIYRIPKEEFESVIMEYFNIDSEMLRSKTNYFQEDATYEYKPRGFYECEYPEIPYPEVVDYAENVDGTITLTVNVVYPDMCIGKMFAHEVVVRPLENGGVQYVSNRIIPSQENYKVTWHTDRLTEEEWEEFYGGETKVNNSGKETETTEEVTEAISDDTLWFLPKAGDCLLTEKEKEQLQKLALSAAEQVKGVYKDAEISEALSRDSNVKSFTRNQRKEVVELLGKADFVSVSKDINMENYEEIQMFYAAYLEKQDAMVTIFEVYEDGTIGTTTFIYRDALLQTYYVGIGWQEDGTPEIRETLVSDIAEIKLTEKGYFIYAYKDINTYGSLRQYWRIKPLSDKCRELTEKYISGLSYVDYNMLVANWDDSNAEDILMPCMFEDIYRIYTGENLSIESLSIENDRIPADLYEKVMTTYFPVSKEQLRKCSWYDKESNTYQYEKIDASQYPPFGEVLDYTENGDGTITLIVDGVWPDYNWDCAFTNQIVVLPFEDGTFKYLSNSIVQKELELPPSARIKGYDLPIEESEKKEAKADCINMMRLISDIYEHADKGKASNVILKDKTVFEMQDKVKETGWPVTTMAAYSNMENYESVDSFLKECREGKTGSVVIYEVRSDGSIARRKYVFDGKVMYVLSAGAAWNVDYEPVIAYYSYTRIEEWRYTDKGWFCYELCVPQPPEVSEIVDGSYMVRIKPLTEEQRELSEKCVRGLGYQGNNLLCSNWDADHMEGVDYNGLYEYIYEIKYQEPFPAEDYANGIPKDAFERLIMEYLPVTAEQIQEYAVFDEKSQTYAWEQLGCFNYVPTFFGTSIPEVVDIRENEDGTVTLTVDAVCDMLVCEDAVITHELILKFAEDGSFQYLGNKVLDEGIENIPDYKYRIPAE